MIMDKDLDIEKFLIYIEDHHSENTLNAYCTDIYQLVSFMQQHQITEYSMGIPEYVSHLETLNLKPRTKQRKKFVLRKFINWLGVPDVEVTITSSIKKQEKEMSMTHEEIDLFLSTLTAHPKNKVSNARFRDKCIFEIMLSCNLSIPEIIQMKVTDVDSQLYYLEVNDSRYPILVKETRNILSDYLDVRNMFHPKEDYLFLNKYGEKISYSYLNKLFHDYCQKAGLSIRLKPKSMIDGANNEYFSKGINYRQYKNFLKRIKQRS